MVSAASLHSMSCSFGRTKYVSGTENACMVILTGDFKKVTDTNSVGAGVFLVDSCGRFHATFCFARALRCYGGFRSRCYLSSQCFPLTKIIRKIDLLGDKNRATHFSPKSHKDHTPIHGNLSHEIFKTAAK